MNKYAVYDENNDWMFNIEADSEVEAVKIAKAEDARAYHAELISLGDGVGR